MNFLDIFRQIDNSIGLDISDSSIKLVQLARSGKRLKLKAVGRVSLAPGLILDGDIKEEERVAEKIKELVDKPKFGKVTSDKVVASLPESKSFIKLIEVDKTLNRLEDIVESEIRKYIPFSADEIYYDWQVMGENEEVFFVLAGACQRETVNQYMQVIDRAGITVEAFEIETIALARSLLLEESPKFKNEGKNYAVIDIGANRTTMFIYSKNTILFTIDLPISGDKITSAIAEDLNLTRTQAEKSKVIYGLDLKKGKGAVAKVLSHIVDDLNKKIRDSLRFYAEHYGERGLIDEIIISGGGANIKNLQEKMSEALGQTVKLGDPLINLSEARAEFSDFLQEKYNFDIRLVDKKGEERLFQKAKTTKEVMSVTEDTSLTLATAIGLALRNLFIRNI